MNPLAQVFSEVCCRIKTQEAEVWADEQPVREWLLSFPHLSISLLSAACWCTLLIGGWAHMVALHPRKGCSLCSCTGCTSSRLALTILFMCDHTVNNSCLSIYLSFSLQFSSPEMADLCSTGDHDCQQICVSTPGSYTCACRDGFTLNDDGKTCNGMIQIKHT